MRINICKSLKYIPLSSSPSCSLRFVPKHESVLTSDINLLQDFVDSATRLFVITGAGISTESDVPDYRSEGVGLYARTNHRPMKIQEFLSSPESRKRYWARNFIGWPTFSTHQPNHSHYCINHWADAGKVSTVLTQNVDGLHSKAGTNKAIELHGSAYTVLCLNCSAQISRYDFQRLLESANPEFSPKQRSSEVRPDGDIFLEESEVSRFILPSCDTCKVGIMQPDIVFFGANVKRVKVDAIYEKLSECDSVLVLGSSLQVFSSLRFVLRAKELNQPVAIVSLGPTRGDNLANIKIKARLGELLPLIKV